MLVKDSKKDTKSLDNYRPIFLTDTICKVYASLLQRRVVHHLDSDIRDRQFGFRPSRSATQPIHIMKRIIEVHERQAEPLHALFLDWSKAFDSVTFAAIEKSLHFIGVPTQFVQAIMTLYNNPKFTVRDSGNVSKESTQTRGLRQECPLSPYFFGFVLSHLFKDVEDAYPLQFGELPGIFQANGPLWDREYADDTVLLGNSSYHMNRLLHLVQHFGKTRGLKLNEEKCQHLRFNSDHNIFYSPSCNLVCRCPLCHAGAALGEPAPVSDEIKYLGVFLDSTSSNSKNVRNRVCKAITASKLL